MFGMFWLTVTCVYCGLAPTTTHLIIARALQGIGAAANIPSAVGAITDMFDDPKERNIALSQFGAASPLGFICGLFVSGAVGQALGWRSVFYIYSCLTFLVLVIRTIVLPKDTAVNRREAYQIAAKIDYIGAFLSTGSPIRFIYAITAGSDAGWSSPQILTPLFLSFIGTTVFIWWEKRATTPLIPATFFTPQSTLLLIMTFLVFFAFNGFAVFANLALRQV
ncbi:UNVERIFIED_CONTAM: hypothetical protein HDU68_002454 [Siphonaria sp. JEL0065]|nr:hypothetical protein HDU68_002454 [Siphonaria sp. JEL0065]